jgi:hypothetical protein
LIWHSGYIQAHVSGLGPTAVFDGHCPSMGCICTWMEAIAYLPATALAQ